MKSVHYFPPTDPEGIIWAGNFEEKIKVHAEALKLSDEELKEILADTAHYLWVLRVMTPAVQNFTQEMTTYRNHFEKGNSAVEMKMPAPPVFADRPPERPAGFQNRLFTFVLRVKSSPGYNELIGQELRIINTQVSTPEHRFPTLNPEQIKGPDGIRIQIKFRKFGHHGITIQSKRFGEEWEDLGVDNMSPHLDERPLKVANVPEIREYRACFWDAGKSNGDWCPAVSVSVI